MSKEKLRFINLYQSPIDKLFVEDLLSILDKHNMHPLDNSIRKKPTLKQAEAYKKDMDEFNKKYNKS